MTSRLKKISYTTAAGLGLVIGAAGIAAASSSDTPASVPAAVVEPADVPEAPDTGVNCEDGIDSATGDECDGGPAAALADEATEAPDAEDDPEATETEATDGDEAETDDGVDHQFEGEEVGENGNGIADADDLNGTEVDD